ncbi:zinc dependent phospholipase C family protein [Clostridium thermarum]|uniref:zinc dependent phospholipase C family protein n=1 Tax=Clostridium thermarum TaxID=1716543 RepID=UPI0013D7CA94|nr:zinc dependent phospholipase C family protein [Clostridium thermarum]
MATWISHFRIADYFINKLEVDEKEFIVGNIGPDCGEPNEDWSKFTPPSSVTHWTVSGKKSEIDPEAFYNRYLTDSKLLSKKKYSFYIGYYLHLLTDVEFTKLVAAPKFEKYSQELEKDKNFIWTMKEDWYDIDHLYLRKHPDFYVFKVFSEIEEFPNDYLDYYSQTAMIKQIKYITNFYKSFESSLDREYTYLTPEETESFIYKACENIKYKLIEKGILRDC